MIDDKLQYLAHRRAVDTVKSIFDSVRNVISNTGTTLPGKNIHAELKYIEDAIVIELTKQILLEMEERILDISEKGQS